MSAKPQRQCWSCKQMFPHEDRHCPNCGADAWNPPQGRSASGRAFDQIPVTYTRTTGVVSTAAITAAGVVILATLALLSVWFWVAVWVLGAVNPPDGGESLVAVRVVTLDDYLSNGRVLISFVAAAFLTAVTWGGALKLVGDD